LRHFVTWIVMIATKEEKQRVVSLLCWSSFVVIFFWMGFHQNGLTLTFFARDYTVQIRRIPGTYLFFTLWRILSLILFSLPVMVMLLGTKYLPV
jgi:POT family proton-dependent oligopeptide transporter